MGGSGHIALFRALLFGTTRFSGDQRILSWPFAGHRLGGSSGTNRRDLVTIRPPGTQDGGGFELVLDNVWFCRVLLLFKIKSQTDSGLKEFECAYVTVLEQNTGRRAPGMLVLFPSIFIFPDTSLLAEWMEATNSAMIYEREGGDREVLYVIPVESILGKLPVVPVGDTGTIPHTMRAERARDLDGARCVREMGKGDGTRCWFVNNWAMVWSREIQRK